MPNFELFDVIEIRPVREQEVDQALALLFYEPSEAGGSLESKIASFKQLAQREGYDLSRQIVAQRDGQMFYACFFVANEGGTAFVFTAGVDDENSEDYQLALKAVEPIGESKSACHQSE